MTVYSYYTIDKEASGMYKEKGSKFLAFAYPVDSEEEIKIKIGQVKKMYYDARHHCYAWVLGADKNRHRVFDDGEPTHSAGDPILGQMRSRNLTNVLIIVVRYFGGVKLGVGGLIGAYKAAADDALGNALIIEKEVTENWIVRYPYEATPEVMRIMKEFAAKIVRQQFEDSCELKVCIPVRDAARLMERISRITNVEREKS